MSRSSFKTALAILLISLSCAFVATQAYAYVNINWALRNTDPYCPHRAGCHEQVHSVTLTAGTTYTFDMRSSQFDSYMFLEDSGRRALARDDDSGGNLNARIVWNAQYTGTYYVVASSFNQGATGNYSITVTP